MYIYIFLFFSEKRRMHFKNAEDDGAVAVTNAYKSDDGNGVVTSVHKGGDGDGAVPSVHEHGDGDGAVTRIQDDDGASINDEHDTRIYVRPSDGAATTGHKNVHATKYKTGKEINIVYI